MPLVKTLFLIAAGWELIRFAVLYLLFATHGAGGVIPVDYFITLWFGAPQLALAAAFLFTGLFPQRYGVYLNLLRLGKLLALFSGVPALVVELTAVLSGELPGVAFGTRMLAGGGVLAVDLLLLVFLLSLRNEEYAE